MSRITHKVKGTWQGTTELKRHVDLTKFFGMGKVECPWHKETIPSLHVYPDHVHCFGCGATADALTYIMTINEMTFDEAIEWLEDHKEDSRVKLPEKIATPVPWREVGEMAERLQALPDSHYAKAYLLERGLEPTILTAARIGWNGYSFTIPHIVNGEVVNVKYRVHPRHQQPTMPKYTSLEHRAFDYLYPWDLFRLHHFNSPDVYLCEGEFDALIGMQTSLPFLSLPSGSNSPVEKWIPFFRTRRVVYLLVDQDQAGDTCAKNILEKKNAIGKTLAEMMAPTQVLRVTWDPKRGKDVTDARVWLIPKVRLLHAKIVQFP